VEVFSLGFVLINKKTGKRLRNNKGELLPFMEYRAQAVNYIIRRLNNDPYVGYKEVNSNGRR